MTSSDLSGVLALLKPVGPTSHDVVARVRRWLPGVTAGHLGTLDPAAAGVLLVAVGAATRAARFLDPPDTRKTYKAWIVLGAVTDSDDAEGHVVRAPGAAGLTAERLAAAVAGRVGRHLQVPPARSAVRVAGRHAYARARAGEHVELAPREVVVERGQVEAFEPPDARSQPMLARALVSCTVWRGAYVRAWARDIGEDLGTGAYVRVLVRTTVGRVAGADALTLEEAQSLALAGRLHEALWPVDRLLVGWPVVSAAPDPLGREVGRGRPAPAGAPDGWVRLVDPAAKAGGATAWALAEVVERRFASVVRLGTATMEVSR